MNGAPRYARTMNVFRTGRVFSLSVWRLVSVTLISGVDPSRVKAVIAHTKHHRGLVGVVFKSQESEVIAGLLHAWTGPRIARTAP